MAKSKSNMNYHRSSIPVSKHHGSAGSSGNSTQQVNDVFKKNVSATSNVVTSANQLSSRETYTVYRVKDGKEYEDKTRTGHELRDKIADGVLEYDKKLGVWVTKKGRYIIRRNRSR